MWDEQDTLDSLFFCARRRAARVSVLNVICMAKPDLNDDTSADYEQFEAELLAQDQDAVRVGTADMDDSEARNLVNDLLDAGIVIPIAEKRVLVHDPSSEAFKSITQLAVFHKGWTVACNAGEETA
ncbi:hypothetical protein C496_23633 [Natronorubrum tibetense GA33]|uniref:DUF8069 domain-containing protein n=2 Tax=Natronorubrum tibetense TaxID=63128 RepID=L9VE74_9EURY|nr:hypothetical protein C496_23633 [Natronorubrum tibetense GA33]